MLRWRNILIGFAIVLLIVGAVVVNQKGQVKDGTATTAPNSGPIEPDRDQKPEKGFAAPDFELNTLSGERVRLYENNGKPTLVNFWASWCPPCKVEMPHLQAAYEEYGDEINFLMVDLAFNDDLDAMTKYIEENGYTFPIPLDETGDVATEYQAIAIPTTFIVDEEGIIVHHVQGAMTEQQIKSFMKEMTKEAPGR